MCCREYRFFSQVRRFGNDFHCRITTLVTVITSSNGNIFRLTGPLSGEFTGEFLSQRPVTRSFDVFFDLCLNKRLSNQSWGWWFGTPLCPLWRRYIGQKWVFTVTHTLFYLLHVPGLNVSTTVTRDYTTYFNTSTSYINILPLRD